MGFSRKKSDWEFFEGEIAGGSSQDFDSIPFSELKTRLFVVHVESEAGDLFRSEQILAQRSDSDVRDVSHSKIGDNLQVSIQYLKSGSDAFLRVTNSESFLVSVSIQRLKM